MNDHKRLSDLKDILDLLYAKLGEFEKEIILTASASSKFELKQKIKREILPKIRRYEKEYWELYPLESIIISEEEAETGLAQIENAITSMELVQSAEYPPKMVLLFQDIKSMLEDMNKPASAKLKLALPLIPAIASYEFEMSTEGLMYKAWNSIKEIVKR